MYLYYDKTNTLKEIINDKAIVSESVNANKIYVMYENDQEASYSTSYICYLKGNGEHTDTYLQNAVTNPFATEPSKDCYIPYDEKRDLKFFKYGKPYRFRVFNIPSEDLKGYTSASGTVWYVLDPNNDTTISGGEVINGSDDTAEAMTMFSFAINSSTGYVKKDDYISLSQWNQLLLLIDTTEIRQAIETLQSYFTGGAAKNALKLDDHTASYFASQSDLINALAALTYVSTFGGKSGAITLGSGLSMNGNELNISGGGIGADTWRNIKVNGTEKLGTGTNTGALDLVAGSNITLTVNNGAVTISSSGGGQTSFNLIVCQTANETPDVATISVGGSTISGTLAPSASTVGTLYLCNDATNPVTNDIYTEYVTAQKPNNTSTINVEESDENVSVVEDPSDVYTVTITVSDKVTSVTSCDIQTTSITHTDHTIVLVMGGQAYEDFQRDGAEIVYVPYPYFWEKFGTTPTSVTAGVTSVALSVPTGLSVSGSPITSSGTLNITLASGYIIPTADANGCITSPQGYLTTAPTQDNPHGLITVVLTSEPATYYNGYHYIITEQ